MLTWNSCYSKYVWFIFITLKKTYNTYKWIDDSNHSSKLTVLVVIVYTIKEKRYISRKDFMRIVKYEYDVNQRSATNRFLAAHKYSWNFVYEWVKVLKFNYNVVL